MIFLQEHRVVGYKNGVYTDSLVEIRIVYNIVIKRLF